MLMKALNGENIFCEDEIKKIKTKDEKETLTIISVDLDDAEKVHEWVREIGKNGGIIPTGKNGKPKKEPKVKLVPANTDPKKRMDMTEMQYLLFKQFCRIIQDTDEEYQSTRKFVKLISCPGKIPVSKKTKKGKNPKKVKPCPKAFFNKHLFYEHIRSHHRDLLKKLKPDEQDFVCPHCDKPQFISRRSIDKHLINCFEGPFLCTGCYKDKYFEYKTVDALRVHRRQRVTNDNCKDKKLYPIMLQHRRNAVPEGQSIIAERRPPKKFIIYPLPLTPSPRVPTSAIPKQPVDTSPPTSIRTPPPIPSENGHCCNSAAEVVKLQKMLDDAEQKSHDWQRRYYVSTKILTCYMNSIFTGMTHGKTTCLTFFKDIFYFLG